MIEIPEELEKAYKEYRIRYIAQELLKISETEPKLVKLTDKESLRLAKSLEVNVNVDLLKGWNDPDCPDHFLCFSQYMVLLLALKAEGRKNND